MIAAILGLQLPKSQSASESLVPHVLQLFEYILEYLRTVRFGEPDHSLALPADQTELAQIVREVSKHLTSLLQQPQHQHACIYACLCSVFVAVLCVLPMYVQQLSLAAVGSALLHVVAAQALQLPVVPRYRTMCLLIVSYSTVCSACAAGK